MHTCMCYDFSFQVFHCHFNSNFFPLFLEALLGNSVSQTFSSFLLGKLEFSVVFLKQQFFLWIYLFIFIYLFLKALSQMQPFVFQVCPSWHRTSTICTFCRYVASTVSTVSSNCCSSSSFCLQYLCSP